MPFLLDQVFLGVDGALGGQTLGRGCSPATLTSLRTRLLAACLIADEGELGVRGALQVEGEVIEAGLAFVVDASRTAGIAIEADRAEVLRGRLVLRRRRRCKNRNRGVRGGSLTLVVDDVTGNGNRAWSSTGGGQGGGAGRAADRASRGAIAVGQRTILRADAGGGDGGGVAGVDGGRVRRAGQGWRLKLFDGEVDRAVGHLAGLRAFGNVALDGVGSGGRRSWCRCSRRCWSRRWCRRSRSSYTLRSSSDSGSERFQ